VADNKSATKKLPVTPSAGPRKSTSSNDVAGKANVPNSPATPKEAAARKRASARPVKGRFHLAWLREKRLRSTNEIFHRETRRLVRSPDHVERQRTYPVQDFTNQIDGIFNT
jgi:hypothetical protein